MTFLQLYMYIFFNISNKWEQEELIGQRVAMKNTAKFKTRSFKVKGNKNATTEIKQGHV